MLIQKELPLSTNEDGIGEITKPVDLFTILH